MKQNIIIFVGHDRSGKSTIAQELSKRTGIPYFKVQRDKHKWDPAANLQYLTGGITQFIEQTKASVILDRWHPCDYTYSNLFNREVDMNIVNEIDDKLSNMDALIVCCFKDEEQYEFDEEDKDFVNPSMYSDMTMLYRNYLMTHSECRYIFINTSDRDLEGQLKVIQSQI